MADQLAAEFAQRQISADLAALLRDAESLAESTAAYVVALKAGRPASGDANRIVQDAVQLAQRAARYEGMRETVAYLAPNKEN